MIAVPSATAVTLPSLSTVATFASEDFQATVLAASPVTFTSADNWAVSPATSASLPSLTPSPETATESTDGVGVGVTASPLPRLMLA